MGANTCQKQTCTQTLTTIVWITKYSRFNICKFTLIDLTCNTSCILITFTIYSRIPTCFVLRAGASETANALRTSKRRVRLHQLKMPDFGVNSPAKRPAVMHLLFREIAFPLRTLFGRAAHSIQKLNFCFAPFISNF